MGVRISFYVVDLSRFEAYIEKPLADVLWDYAENGENTKRSLSFSQEASQPQSFDLYWAMPGEGVRIRTRAGKIWKTLTKEAVHSETFLVQKTRNYLSKKDSASLRDLLDCLSHCPSLPWIRTVSEGYRRWWIGSLLDYAERDPRISAEDYATAINLFQKILRPYDCGKPLPERDFTLEDFDFPVSPADDEGLWMGVWTESELTIMLQFLDNLTREPSGEPHKKLRK